MKHTTLILSALLLGGALLVVVRPADAAPIGRVLPSYPAGGYHPPVTRPIGWDWWRTYPYSDYNYGRNPYNPIIYPYPGAYYPPVMIPDQRPEADPMPVVIPQQPLTPHPTGEIRVLPANAGGIQVRLPVEFGQVEFDGVKVSSVGTTRTYVTPDLPNGKPVQYTVTATWKRDGRSVTQEQQVTVGAGKTVIADFTR